MKLAELYDNGLHTDPLTIHAITRDDEFSAIVREALFDSHPTLSNGRVNIRKFNKGGNLTIDRPSELDGFEVKDIRSYLNRLSKQKVESDATR